MQELEAKYGLIPDMDWIELDKLSVDSSYQRDTLSRRSIQNIIKIRDNFSFCKCSPLTVVNLGNDHFSIIDGQHRFEAAKQLGDINSLPCWIIPQTPNNKQADAFIDINKNRVSITAYAVYKAEVVAGEIKALMVDDFCRKNNITIPKNSVIGSAPNVTNALQTIKLLLKQGKEENLAYAIKILRTAFPFKPGQLQSKIIKALVDIHIQHAGKINDNILISSLRSFDDVSNIIRKAGELSNLDKSIKSSVALKKIISNRYNEIKRKSNV